MSDIVILTEAGGSVGYGHLMRCLAIANHANSEIYVHSDGEYPKNNLIKPCQWRTELNRLTDMIPDSSSILVDSYLAQNDLYEILSEKYKFVSVLDDYNRIEYPVSLIINPGVKQLNYNNQTAKVVGGNEYIILRDEIIQHKRKSNYDEYENLLITFGGSNAISTYENLMPLLSGLSKMRINIITGNINISIILSKKYDFPNINWYGQANASEMAALMFRSDLCVCSGGQTLHELAYIGVPAICIETGKDQKNNIDGYFDHGFLLNKFSLKTSNLLKKLHRVLSDYTDAQLRKEVSDKGKFLVDGQGANRIAGLL